jgi:hypothetical protein
LDSANGLLSEIGGLEDRQADRSRHASVERAFLEASCAT